MKRTNLPPHLEPLIEGAAGAIHEAWAELRREEGWTYGPQRDDARRKHPCLVPYDALAPSEREYDRRSAQITMTYLYDAGFSIERR